MQMAFYMPDGIPEPVPPAPPEQPALFRLDLPELQADEVRCRKCWQWKPWDAGYAWIKNGTWCPDCSRQYRRDRRAIPEIREAIRQRQRDRMAIPEIREAKRQLDRNRRAIPEIKEAKRQRERDRRAIPEIREAMRQRQRDWYAIPEIREARRQYRRDRSKTPAGRAVRRKWKSIRRARNRSAVCQEHYAGCFAAGETELRAAPDPICAEPGCDERDNLDADHIMPLQLDGQSCLVNCQLLCKRHNLSKKDKHPADWAAYQRRPMTNNERRAIAWHARMLDRDLL